MPSGRVGWALAASTFCSSAWVGKGLGALGAVLRQPGWVGQGHTTGEGWAPQTTMGLDWGGRLFNLPSFNVFIECVGAALSRFNAPYGEDGLSEGERTRAACWSTVNTALLCAAPPPFIISL